MHFLQLLLIANFLWSPSVHIVHRGFWDFLLPRKRKLSVLPKHSLLLISNKFWMGGGGWGVGGGEARGPSWRGRIRGVEGENKRGEGGK